jgi:hypothetical protein
MERTDLTKWKLYVDRGRQVWKYNPEQRPTEQKFYDKYFLGLDVVSHILIVLFATGPVARLGMPI